MARIARWIPAACWMAVIFMASTDMLSAAHTSRIIGPLMMWLFPHLSAAALDTVHLCIRKGGHLFEYSVLGLLVWRAVPGGARRPGAFDWRRAARSLLVVTLYAATDEYHQTFVPSRGPAVHDVLIDAAGAAIALACAGLGSRKRSLEKSGDATASVAE